MRKSVLERRAHFGLLVLATLAALSAPASAWAVQISGCTILPPENPWNRDVSGDPVSTALTSTYVANINQGTNKNLHPDFGTNPLYGIPFVVVSGTQAKVPINFVAYPAESDPGPYPVPPTAPIEGGVNGTGDRHVIVLDKDNALLYEMFNSSYQNPAWNCDSGAIWDMSANTLRPAGWTSADAGGLPILPGLVRYDEVATGAITHALRFTVPETQQAYVYPATHKGASANTNAPPMGTRLRLKASFDITGYTGQSRIILQALKTYGMINADRGSGWYISGTSDSRWDDNDLNQLKSVPGTAFEVLVPPVTYALTVNNGAGSGGYPANTPVKITANAPPAGKVFDQWTGATVANAFSAVTTITTGAAASSVTATYKTPTTSFTLTVTSGSGSGTYAAGTVVTITANAAPAGQIFKQWTGATVANANASTTTITMPAANTTVTATYQNTYTLTVTSGSGGGTYIAGAVVTITANAAPAGQIFKQWTGATVANANASTTTITMPAANTAVTATYQNTYTLTVTSGSGGGTYIAGAVVTITANAPPAGQVFNQWTGATVANANATTTTITMPAANTTVTATYKAGPTFTLTVVSGSGGGSFGAGNVVAIVANAPPTGQVFDQWTGATVASATSASTTLTMPASNVTVTATYKAVLYTLTVTGGSGSGSYAAGTSVAISANAPPSGQVFDQWTGASVGNAQSASTVITMPAASTALTATFKAAPAPVLSSGPTATPNPAVAGQAVQFACVASGSGPFLWNWNFGDGATDTTSGAVSHTYSAAGTYAVTVTVTDTFAHASSGTLTLVVQPGGASQPGDGSGITDQDKIDAGLDPTNPAAVLTVLPLTIKSLKGKLNLTRANSDSIRVQGSLSALPANFTPLGTALTLTVGSARVHFTLDAKGRGKSANGMFALKLKTKRNKTTHKMDLLPGAVVFQANLSKGSWNTLFSAQGISATATQSPPAALNAHVSVIVPATLFGGDGSTTYTAKKGIGNFALKK